MIQNNHIYKVLTSYTIDDRLFTSEIFFKDPDKLHELIALRGLTNECVINKPVKITNNACEVINDKVDQESISFYIRKGNYIDAAHRVMYLTTILNDPSVSHHLLLDNGLIHELIHAKTNKDIFEYDIESMIKKANALERIVPGTYLWVLDNQH